jgi:D-alanyl-D-alanine endopeptidase (penicillin-binding protein 7)
MDEISPENINSSKIEGVSETPFIPPLPPAIESPSFFPPAPLEKKETFPNIGNTWRNVLAIVLLFSSCFGTFLYLQKENKPWEMLETWAHLDISGILEKKDKKIGGDIDVAPPLPPPPPIPELRGELPLPETFTAKAMLVKDVVSGKVLYQKNEYEIRPLASISKLMTALVFLEFGLDWNATTTVNLDEDIEDFHVIGGAVYTLEDLWKAGLIASSNQSMLALVDSTGIPREAFVARMNEKALELGMRDSHFEEPTGLSANNVSTASDIILLLDEALRQPKIQETLILKEVNISPVGVKKLAHFWSTNWLLLKWIPNKIQDFRGGKTGYIVASGYNFTMQLAHGDEKVLDVVVLGADVHEARFTEARDVAAAVFNAYHWPIDDVVTSTEEVDVSSSTPEAIDPAQDAVQE